MRVTRWLLAASLVALTASAAAAMPPPAKRPALELPMTVNEAERKGFTPDAIEGRPVLRKPIMHRLSNISATAMHDFVVFIVGPVGTTNGVTAVVPGGRVDQRGATFSPHVLPVVMGGTVEWPNSDDIYHNAFSISDCKEFDLGLYKAPEVKRVTFDRPGRVDVFCSIHKTMSCVVLVLENPFYAATDSRGRYRIPAVPPGTYKLKAWHERLPAQVKEITVGAESADVSPFARLRGPQSMRTRNACGPSSRSRKSYPRSGAGRTCS